MYDTAFILWACVLDVSSCTIRVNILYYVFFSIEAFFLGVNPKLTLRKALKQN